MGLGEEQANLEEFVGVKWKEGIMVDGGRECGNPNCELEPGKWKPERIGWLK
jgi:hypothetical protein